MFFSTFSITDELIRVSFKVQSYMKKVTQRKCALNEKE